MKTMTPAQKRVAIAKDVIAQLEAGKFVATKGRFILPENNLSDSDNGKPLQPLIRKMGVCEVCAAGASVLSAVRLFNAHCVDSWKGVRYSRDVMRNWFSDNQATLIEGTFEGWDNSMFYLNHIPDGNDRLIAIMKNVVRNRGTFKPTTKDFPKARELATV